MGLSTTVHTIIDTSASMLPDVIRHAIKHAPGSVYLVNRNGVVRYPTSVEAEAALKANQITISGEHRAGFFNVVREVQRHNAGDAFWNVGDCTSGASSLSDEDAEILIEYMPFATNDDCPHCTAT